MGVKLIAGLGNPGARYAFTRHNAGFMAVDIYTGRRGLKGWEKRKGYLSLKADLECGSTCFLKPGLFMNLSGGPAREALASLGAGPADLLVFHDDIDVPLGQARYKLGGGHGGHNGLRSIIESIGSADFHRIRLGVGRPPDGVGAADYVLSPFSGEEEDVFLDSLETAFDLLEGRFLSNK